MIDCFISFSVFTLFFFSKSFPEIIRHFWNKKKCQTLSFQLRRGAIKSFHHKKSVDIGHFCWGAYAKWQAEATPVVLAFTSLPICFEQKFFNNHKVWSQKRQKSSLPPRTARHRLHDYSVKRSTQNNWSGGSCR